MSQPTNYWKLGLLVTVSFLGALAILGWVGAQRLERESIESHYYFDEQVNGLEVGSPVKFRGVTIGKVVTIRVAPDQRHVEVVGEIFVDALERIGLQRDARGPEDGPFVPSDLRVQLVQNLLTGTSFVQGDFFDSLLTPIPEYGFEVPWNTVHTVPSAGKGLSEGLGELLAKLPATLDELSQTLHVLHASVDRAELGRVSSELRALMASLRERFENLDDLELLKQGTHTLVQVEETMTRVRGSLDGFDGLVRQVREESSLDETAQAVRQASGRAAIAVDELGLLSRTARESLARWDETMSSLRRVAELLERDPAALIHGRELRRIPDSVEGR